MHNISITVSAFLLFISLISPFCIAGEVELFIPSEKAEEYLKNEKSAQKIEYQKKFASFKKEVDLPAIHENTLSENKDILTTGGPVTIADNSISFSKKLAETSIIHENSIHSEQPVLADKVISDNIKIHENSIEFTNFIVHENSVNNKYSTEILTAKVPDSNKIWNTASSQATLLFSKTASKRDKATKELIKNGNWLNVAEKLLASDNEITRINGINLLKAVIENPKYRDIPVAVKINKLSPLLLASLNDSNTKVRFLAALMLNKLTGTNFNYDFSSDPVTQVNTITAWNNYIRSIYGS